MTKKGGPGGYEPTQGERPFLIGRHVMVGIVDSGGLAADVRETRRVLVPPTLGSCCSRAGSARTLLVADPEVMRDFVEHDVSDLAA